MENFMAASNQLLDPTAQEFYPTSQTTLHFPHIYYPYPPPPPPPQPEQAPSRAVTLTLLHPHVTEPAIINSMMSFGGIRTVDVSRLPESVATVHFYDIRSAQVAVDEIRAVYYQFSASNFVSVSNGRGLIDGHVAWAQFGSDDMSLLNHGLLFVNVSASLDVVLEVLRSFGPVMNVKESQTRKQHKFVQYFDVRDAARAFNDLNGKIVRGRRYFVQFCKPGCEESISYERYQKRQSHPSLSLPPRLQRANIEEENVGLVLRRNDSMSSNASKNSSKASSSGEKGSIGSGNRHITSTSSSQSKPRFVKKGYKYHVRGKTGESSRSEDWKYEIKEELNVESGSERSSATSSCGDSRTTVMIRNIPNKYSRKLLLNLLDEHCMQCNEQIGGGGGEEPLSAYDFVYLPIDFNNKCNVGYGFVNLTTPEAALRLHKALHSQPWEVFNSRKICEVTYARVQGLEALKEHFSKSKFACDVAEYMPAVFDPPRDGKQQTEPDPIGCRQIEVMPRGRNNGEEEDPGDDNKISYEFASQLQL